MPTLEEVAARVNFLLEQGGHDRKCHFGLVDVETKERIANPKGRTRLIKELDTPEAYSDWEAEWDRWIQACGGHKPIAQDLMLRHLQQVLPSDIAKMMGDEQSEEKESLADA